MNSIKRLGFVICSVLVAHGLNVRSVEASGLAGQIRVPSSSAGKPSSAPTPIQVGQFLNKNLASEVRKSVMPNKAELSAQCKAEYDLAGPKVEACINRCMVMDPPTPGTPADGYKALSDFGKLQRQGNLTGSQFVTALEKDQITYCVSGKIGPLNLVSAVDSTVACHDDIQAMNDKLKECGKLKNAAKAVCADLDKKAKGLVLGIGLVHVAYKERTVFKADNAKSISEILSKQATSWADLQKQFEDNKCDSIAR